MINVFRWIEKRTLSSLVEPRLAAAKLVFLAGLSGVVYWLAFVRPANLLEIYDQARPDLYYLYAAGSPVHLGIILAFIVLAVMYWLAYRLVQQMQGGAGWIIVLGGSAAFAAILMFVFPFDAADIFDYIIHGRMAPVYGGNPYLNIPRQFPHDPFYPYVAWKDDPSPYGPVWEILAGITSHLAGDGIVANIWAYKLIPGLFLFGSLGVVALVLRQEAPKQALAGTLLLAWNPLVLYETWAHGHNDMVMVFWILAAVWAISRQRYLLSVMSLVISALVKFVPVLLIPVALAIALRELPDLRRRIVFLVQTAAGAILIGVVAYSPFWYGPEAVTVVNRTRLFTSSIPAVIYYTLRDRLGVDEAASLVAAGALVVTLLFVIWQAYLALRGGGWQRFTQSSFNILAFYLLVTCLWFQQWYTVWLIGLAPLLFWKQARRFAILFGFAALSKQLLAGPILFLPRPTLHQPVLEIWFTLGVLGIPWLYALYTLWSSRRRSRRSSRRSSRPAEAKPTT